MAHVSTNFGDLLDPRFQKIFREEVAEADSMLGTVYEMVPSNGRDTYRLSSVGALPDWSAFSGTVTYVDGTQGYDVVATPLEWASGIQIERKLYDDDQFSIMESRPRQLATSFNRTKETHGARLFNQAFSNDTLFYVNSEGVALCSNSHTTTSGASTSTGFDNYGTASLTATAVNAARTQMRYFRGDQGQRLQIVPDELWIPIDLYEKAFEIVNSMGKVDTDLNNRNVHKGAYTVNEWIFLSDANNWFMADSKLRREYVKWMDRVPVEFAQAEDLDALVEKWRGYARYSPIVGGWRWVMGNEVS